MIRAGGMTPVPLRKHGSFELVDVAALAKSLAIETTTDSNGNWLYVSLPQEISFRVGNPWVRVGTKILQLPLPVERTHNNYWVPLGWAVTQLTAQGLEEAVFDSSTLSLTLKPSGAVWKGIHGETDDDEVVLTLQLPKGPFVETALQKNVFTIKVTGAKVVDSLFASDFPKGLVTTKTLFNDDPPQVVLTFNNEIATVETLSTRSWRISLKEYLATSKSGNMTPKLVTGAASTKIDEAKKRWQFDCIIIDAGHGGKDPGARGNGLKEKDLTLDIAQRLAELFRNDRTMRVVLTRSSDSFVTLQDRGKIANHRGGKLFVSIHINASRDKDGSGIETYFLSPAKTERALEVSKFENEVVQLESDKSAYAGMTGEKMILLSMAQSQFLKESQKLAEDVQKEAVKRIGLSDRGVDQAGFYVLVGASMPAILFECAFISNKRDAKILGSTDGRQRYAEALYQGIAKFRDTAK